MEPGVEFLILGNLVALELVGLWSFSVPKATDKNLKSLSISLTKHLRLPVFYHVHLSAFHVENIASKSAILHSSFPP